MMPKVSVVIPCYNQGAYLGDAIESALDQDYREREIVVINDGSTDETREVAKQYSGAILYIEQENRGPARARNAGIRASTGEYVAFLDSDDLYLTGFLMKQAGYLDGHPQWSLVSGDAILFDEKGRRELWTSWIGRPSNCRDFRWELYCPPSCTVMVRRSALDQCGLFDEHVKGSEDWNLWLRIGLAGRKAFQDEPLALHRRHTENVSNDEALIHYRNRDMMRSIVEAPYFAQFPDHFRSGVLAFLAHSTWGQGSTVRAAAYLVRALAACPRMAPKVLKMIGRMVKTKACEERSHEGRLNLKTPEGLAK
jgi:glycosyltransferase involved in cell wall biosynthesis